MQIYNQLLKDKKEMIHEQNIPKTLKQFAKKRFREKGASKITYSLFQSQ